ncbi:non-ribosomal peptide synthetase [Clostridium sp.]|uniref:non-ribosomal peptide synthetase n=1 Tax=Clostridium sp. TaxID=1506 RepID=UPI00260EB28D|nr:non-ribosomal peptide synthetase [Clostridium sp.]
MRINTLYNEIDEFAKKTPQKVAIEHGINKMTYNELYIQSTAIAARLAKENVYDENVAIIMDRSIEMITSLIGIMKSGAIFIPIDPNYPENRIEYMLINCECKKVITNKHYQKKFSHIFSKINNDFNIILIDDKKEERDINDVINYSYNEKCYIFYTSGSTGNPKGILGKHSSLMQFIKWEIKEFKINSDFRISQIISPAFDASLRDIFVPLVAGATLCIPENNDIILNPLKLSIWIDNEKITLTHMVKTLFINMINEVNKDNVFQSLKYVFLSGEALHGSDIKKAYELFDERIKIINLYGATETTLVKTFYMVEKKDINKSNIAIGKPIDGSKIYILNNELEECKQNECGEIYIESDYITFGYYNDKLSTQEKFIKSKFSKSKTTLMYKSGDIGRKLEDGNYECLGRVDRQIKINGVRIELNEIENVFGSNFNVNEVIATSISNKNRERIYLYYSGNEEFSNDKVREELSKYLPAYMIPAKCIYIKKMPTLPNGKIDVNSLPTIVQSSKTKEEKNDFDEYENKVAEVICDVLEVEYIGIDEDFFTLGGNSIDAAQVASKLYKKYGFHILISDILKVKTVRNIAGYIKENKQHNKYTPILKDETLKEYPLTSNQRSMFILNKINKVGITYNLHDLIEIEGKINVENINLAYKKLIKEEESLRTFFKMKDGEIVQIINEDVDANIEIIDYSDIYKDRKLTSEDIKKILKNLIKEFDLEKAPLIRMYLIKIAEERQLLLIDIHHIIADGTSQELIKYKLSHFINNKFVESSNVRYGEYSLWKNNRLKENKVSDMKNYWMRLYEDDIPVVDLPTDFNRPAMKSFKGDSIIKLLDKDLSKKIKEFSAKESKTVYSYMLTVFIVLLNKYASQDDIVIGTVMSGRNHPEFEKIVGMFVDTVPIRVKTNECENFIELLNIVSDTLISIMENQEYPFEKIIEDLKIKPQLSRNQLFDIMFIMQNMKSFDLEMEGIKTNSILIEEERSKFDITLTVSEKDEDMYLNFEYSTDLFKRSTIERMVRHYELLLNQCINNHLKNINEINMILDDEKEFILRSLNNYTNSEFETKNTFLETFLKQVNKDPNNIAITFKEIKMTYGELDITSDYLAKLLQDKFHDHDAIIAIMLKRTPLVLISMIGILKAGYSYLPIDINYPLERIKYMIEDSKCDLILADTRNNSNFGLEVVELDFNQILEKSKKERLSINNCKMDKTAYLIYTSGSTGKPKGVMITNKNLSSFISATKNEIEFNTCKKILALTTISFDIFVLESLLPLSQGLEVVLCDELDQQNFYNIENILLQNNVDILQVTPSRLSLMIETVESTEFLNSVRILIVGGEQFPETLLKALNPLKKTRIFNVYGPTEATVWCSIKELTNEGKITIGRPFLNTDMYIVNKNNKLQPIGVNGELCISGECLSSGYIYKEDITREKFISNPFKKGEIMYKTGDLVRLLDNGEIEFSGRTDFQVKLRGYRIELSEIEKSIENLGVVLKCICSVKKDSLRGDYLVAYYEADDDINITHVRELLSKELPDYMIPSIFMHLDKIPSTKNGKIDRGNLPNPKVIRPTLNGEYKKVSTEVEKEILYIWYSVLGIEDIGVNDNFFELGGNSILLVRMHSKLEEKYKKNINIADIFSHPTIALLAKDIINDGKSEKLINTLELPKEYFNVKNNEYNEKEYKYEFPRDITEKINDICENGYTLESFMFTFYVYILYRISKNTKIYLYKIIDSSKGILSKTYVDIEKYSEFSDLMKRFSTNLELGEIFSINDIRDDEIKNRKNELAIIFSVDKSLHPKIKEVFDLITIVENRKYLKVKYLFNSSKINPDKIEELMGMYLNLVQAIAQESRYIRRNL